MDKREQIKIQVAECTLSLAIALHQAGGGFGAGVLEMTVAEFIALAAQNGVRFIYVPERGAE